MTSEIQMFVEMKTQSHEEVLAACQQLEAFIKASSGNVVHSWTGQGSGIEIFFETKDAKAMIASLKNKLADMGLSHASRIDWAENFEED